MVTDYKAIENCKRTEMKCHCGKKDRLIPYCGFYICVWCRTGSKRVSRLVMGLSRRLA